MPASILMSKIIGYLITYPLCVQRLRPCSVPSHARLSRKISPVPSPYVAEPCTDAADLKEIREYVLFWR